MQEKLRTEADGYVTRKHRRQIWKEWWASWPASWCLHHLCADSACHHLLAAVLVCTMSLTAFAREAPDTSRKGSIQLTIRQGGTAVPGGSFTLYQVGALQEEDGNYRFVLTEAFAGSKVSLEEVSSAQLANTLAAYAKDHKLSGTAKDVDKDGEIAFTGLELGLYLLVQHKAAKGYETAAPFLVSVPMEEDGVLRYDVDASPKVELGKTNRNPPLPRPLHPPTPACPIPAS